MTAEDIAFFKPLTASITLNHGGGIAYTIKGMAAENVTFLKPLATSITLNHGGGLADTIKGMAAEDIAFLKPLAASITLNIDSFLIANAVMGVKLYALGIVTVTAVAIHQVV